MMDTRKAQPLWMFLTLSYMAGIVFFSTQPGGPPGTSAPFMEWFKNFLHFPAYGGLTFLLLKCKGTPWACPTRTVRAGQRPAPTTLDNRTQIICFAIAVAFGVFNEFLQARVPNRFFSVSDMVTNGAGSLLMILLLRIGFIRRMVE